MSIDAELEKIPDLLTCRFLAAEVLGACPGVGPSRAMITHLAHAGDDESARKLRKTYDARLTLVTEVAAIGSHVALGDVGLGRGRQLLRRAFVALLELGKDRRDLERLIRRRAAEPVQPRGTGQEHVPGLGSESNDAA